VLSSLGWKRFGDETRLAEGVQEVEHVHSVVDGPLHSLVRTLRVVWRDTDAPSDIPQQCNPINHPHTLQSTSMRKRRLFESTVGSCASQAIIRLQSRESDTTHALSRRKWATNCIRTSNPSMAKRRERSGVWTGSGLGRRHGPRGAVDPGNQAPFEVPPAHFTILTRSRQRHGL
jgi:hypothetical protein